MKTLSMIVVTVSFSILWNSSQDQKLPLSKIAIEIMQSARGLFPTEKPLPSSTSQ